MSIISAIVRSWKAERSNHYLPFACSANLPIDVDSYIRRFNERFEDDQI